MVGVPRSSGCQLCRKRRVKCDEARPGCGNCHKYGTTCPGYDRGMKFVSGKHQIRQRGKKAEYETVIRLNASSSPSSDSPSSTISIARASPPESPMVVTPAPNRAEFISTVVSSVRTNIMRADVTGFLSWCDLGKLGHRAVLDGAMCSLAMHLVGKENSDQAMIANSRTVYANSLSALQKSLQHATEWKAPETLCSAMMLCIFELFAGTSDSNSWLMHAKGIGTLISQRGPAAHASGWDTSMILAFRGVLIMSDMFFPTEEECFLSRPEWKPIIRDGGRYLIHPKEQATETIHLIDEFFERLAEMPSILVPAYVLRESKILGTAKQRTSDQVISALALRSIEYRRLFKLWYERFEDHVKPPKEIPSQDPESPFDTVFDYDVPWQGSMYIGYWACMLILQEALLQCEWPEDFSACQTEFTRNILRSIETVGAGTMGPYRVGFGVRIAYELSSAEMQLWIRRMLDRYKSTYAATDKATYPEPRTDEQGVS